MYVSGLRNKNRHELQSKLLRLVSYNTQVIFKCIYSIFLKGKVEVGKLSVGVRFLVEGGHLS